LNVVRPDLIILPSVVLSSGINIHVTVTTKIRWEGSGQLSGFKPMNYFDTHNMLATVTNIAEMILYIDSACCTIKNGNKAASQSNAACCILVKEALWLQVQNTKVWLNNNV